MNLSIKIASKDKRSTVFEGPFMNADELPAFLNIAEFERREDWTITVSIEETRLQTIRWMIPRLMYRLFPETRTRHLRNWLNPPPTAEFLFYVFLDPRNCDALVGDLEERYRLIRTKFGKRRAKIWYWTQAIRSVGPIAWAWIKKMALKPLIGVIAWAVAKGLLGHDSWLAALVELYRRIRS